MARLTELEIRQHPDVADPLTLTFSIGTNILYGPPSPSRASLMRLLRGVTTGDFSETAGPLDLRCQFAVPGGQADVTITRAEATGPVNVHQGDKVRVIEEPPPGQQHLIFDGSDALIRDLSAPGGLRAEAWVPPGLRAACADGAGEVDLSRVPELAGLWWHLDYEKGYLTRDGEDGAIGLRLLNDGSSRGLGSLDAAQRRLLSLFYYLSVRPTPLVDASLDHLVEEAIDDALRHVEPPLFGGVPKRQSFFTADSSVLMYRMNIRKQEQLQRAFVVCAPGEPWRALTDAEAKTYFQYYDREFRHIDSLMRLW